MIDLELKSFSNKAISNHALDNKSLPKRIKVLSWGKNETTDGDVYLNENTMKVFETMQKESGRDKDVPLDFGHCTVPGSKEYVAGQPKAIAAYGDPELIKGDGLYLKNLDWTPLGEKHAKNYKDLSPAVSVTHNGVVTGLHSVALTEAGAVHGLKFYSAKGFGDMIKHFSENRMERAGFEIHDANEKDGITDAEYNYRGANAGVKKVGNKYEVHDLDAMDMGTLTATNNTEDLDKEDKEHDEDCGCNADGSDWEDGLCKLCNP